MAHRVSITDDATRDLRRLPRTIRQTVRTHIDRLSDTPRPQRALPLKSDPRRRWRLRIGHYRVFYTVDDAMAIVTVLEVKHRSEAYEG